MRWGLSIAVASTLATAAVVMAETPAPPPPASLASDSRCFELRTYTAAPGKLEALHARFRDHTTALFQKHGMTVVGYWVPRDKDKGADNTLVYMLAYPDCAAREKAWQAFRADPDWVRARDASEAAGKLVEKTDSVLMTATDYSPMK
ncbi:MAG: NIPSNAP family protein [Acidobacteria bacterium]|nr:MAG: NIPSNAP family protein [Acidobacteriota bacterium]